LEDRKSPRKRLTNEGIALQTPQEAPHFQIGLDPLRVSRDREHGFQRIVSNDFRGS
jgi:hypothetical protein